MRDRKVKELFRTKKQIFGHWKNNW